MQEKIINGREIANDIFEKITQKTNMIKEKYNKSPGLAVIYIGKDKASKVYANSIIKKCENNGFNGEKHIFPENTEEAEILELIEKLNNDPNTNGVIIQFPLPKSMNEDTIKFALSPEKDVDCITPVNIGRLYSNLNGFIPCTPKGAIRLLKNTGEDLKGKNAVIIGRSNIVGKPVAELLLQENLTITICHSKTKDLNLHLSNADVIIAAAGRPKLIHGDSIKKGAIVIDVGTNVVDGKLVGDVEFEKAVERASYITPVPGGVGPMTIAMLLENTLEACIKQWELEL